MGFGSSRSVDSSFLQASWRHIPEKKYYQKKSVENPLSTHTNTHIESKQTVRHFGSSAFFVRRATIINSSTAMACVRVLTMMSCHLGRLPAPWAAWNQPASSSAPESECVSGECQKCGTCLLVQMAFSEMVLRWECPRSLVVLANGVAA